MKNRIHVLFRRGLTMLLALMFCLSAASAEVETCRVQGVRFSLQLSLNTDDIRPTDRVRLQGYADLLSSVTFQGTFFAWPEKDQLDLQLEIIPVDSSASPVTLHLYNTTNQLLMSSPVLGSRPVLFSTDSLLSFAVKTHEHLGVNLQYLVLLSPTAYEFASRELRESWNRHINTASGSRKISAKETTAFIDEFAVLLAREDSTINALVDALEICSGYDETVENEIQSLPDYLLNTVTKGKGLTCTVKDGTETWASGKTTLYTRTVTDTGETVLLSLPPTPGGFRPTWSVVSETLDGKTGTDLVLGWLSDNPEEYKDIFKLLLSARGFPAVWPMASDASAEVSLTGSLFPRIYLNVSLRSEADGSIQMDIKSSPESELFGGADLTVNGKVTVDEFEARTWEEEIVSSAIDVLRTNDVTLTAWVRSILRPAVTNLLGFLAGIPASTYQSVLDDLEETGVLNTLLNQD